MACLQLEEDTQTCLICGIPCEEIILCTPETVYVDKEDELEYKNRNKI